MLTFDTKGRDTEIAPKNIRLLKPTDMTIHWKALKEHFAMVPLVFAIHPFFGDKNEFSEFFSKS
jgi:hypothetical protein